MLWLLVVLAGMHRSTCFELPSICIAAQACNDLHCTPCLSLMPHAAAQSLAYFVNYWFCNDSQHSRLSWIEQQPDDGTCCPLSALRCEALLQACACDLGLGDVLHSLDSFEAGIAAYAEESHAAGRKHQAKLLFCSYLLIALTAVHQPDSRRKAKPTPFAVSKEGPRQAPGLPPA